MHRSLIALAVLCLASHAALAERPAISLGSGIEARMQREINPDYAGMKSLGQLFAQLRFEKWALHAEIGEERRDTSSGGLQISAHTINSGLWGRYHLANAPNWTPFMGTGLGAYFDRVTSEYGGTSDERSGIRPYWGLGSGITGVFWKYLLLEAEGRAALVRDRKEAMLSVLLRVGVRF